MINLGSSSLQFYSGKYCLPAQTYCHVDSLTDQVEYPPSAASPRYKFPEFMILTGPKRSNHGNRMAKVSGFS